MEQDLFIFVQCLDCDTGEQQPVDSPIHHLDLFYSEGGFPFPDEDDEGNPILKCASCNGKNITIETYDQNEEEEQINEC
jgi:hypothetical protein